MKCGMLSPTISDFFRVAKDVSPGEAEKHQDAKGEGIDPFLIRIQEVNDQLSAVGEAPELKKLVQLALNNALEELQEFVQSILGRDTLPAWDRMWSNLSQEELRQVVVKRTISRRSSKVVKGEKEEENVALGTKGPSQGQGKKKKKKNLSKVKCFRCGEFGHYSTQCPLKKKDKQEKQDRRQCPRI